MAIKINLNKTERILFCGSKWWGDPDMPENMQYPTVQVTEGGETYDYPLTFVCQINCEDIAGLDPENRLPHEGMLYFFAAIDECLGYETPYRTIIGEWPKGYAVVKYAKSINFETFQSCQLVGDENESLTEPELEMVFEECDDQADGIKLLGLPHGWDVSEVYPEHRNLLQISGCQEAGLNFGSGLSLNILMKDSDLKFGNWKRSKAVFRA
ncbi:MAG: DUF1963 domain-containing protein [Bacteroidales bacterium]|nr:DUF1963 domain-containing protein [Bacteroidales bacterium]